MMDAAQIIPLLSSLLSAAAVVIVAVIETRNGKSRRRTEARAERRAEESRLSMEMMFATCKLATVTAKAVTGHKTNGDVEDALEESAQAQGQYEDFKTQLAAQQVAKV